MSNSLGTLTLSLIAQIGGFTGPMDKASRESQKRMKEMQAHAKEAGAAIGVGMTVAAGAIAAFVKNSINAADETRKTAQAVGLSVEAFSGLQHAAALADIDTQTLKSSMSRLNVTLAEASTGGKEQASVFKAMGIAVKDSAGNIRAGDEVLKDLAERFADMPDGVDKSATAIKIFGKAGAQMIPFLNSGRDGIEELIGQAQKLGLVLTEDQAAASEQFNDSLTVLATVSRGASNSVAKDLLPTLNSLTGMMIDLAENTGTASAFGSILATSLKGVASTALSAGQAVFNIGRSIGGVAAAAAFILEGEWKLAKGVIDGISEENKKGTAETNERIKKLWGTEYQESGKKAAQVANIISKANKIATDDTDKLAKATSDAKNSIDEQVKALQFQAEMVGKSDDVIKLYELTNKGATDSQLALADSALMTIKAFNDQREAAEKLAESQKKSDEDAKALKEQILSDQKSLITSLRTGEEKLTDQTKERLAVLETMKDLTDSERSDVAKRIIASGVAPMPKFGGADSAVAGPQSELNKLEDATSALNDWYTTQLDMLTKFREEKAELSAVWDQQEIDLKKQHEDELARIESARQLVQMAQNEAFFGSMSDLSKTFFGEQSGMYKAMFAIEKAFAIAKVLLNAPSSYSKAYDAMIGIPYVGPVLAPIAGTAAVAAQMAQAANLKSINFTGQAHDGIMSVPESGTWNLKKGERVTTENTSAKLDRTLDNVQRSQQSNGGTVINLIEDKSKAGQSEKRDDNGKETIDIWVANLMGDGKVQKAMTRKFGLQPVGA